MQLFYTDNIESEFYTLTEEESKHCVRVLRMAVGDKLFLTDGQGTLAEACIVDAHPKRCEVRIENRKEHYGERPYRLHLAVAPTKNIARMEWLVEKAVEIGIDSITFVVCQHSERTTLNIERLDKIAISAMKQSLKTYKPVVNAPTPLDVLLRSPFDGQRFIAYCDGDHRTPLRLLYHTGDNALILIGPEGDFSPAEVQAALQSGFQPVTLGPCRLRTETAALAAVAFFNLLN